MQNSKKMKGDTLGNFFPKKSLAMQKKLKVRPFSLFRYCMLRGNPFWFSTLGQQVQFGVFLKFCRTFGRTKKSADKKLIECLPGVAFLKKVPKFYGADCPTSVSSPNHQTSVLFSRLQTFILRLSSDPVVYPPARVS